MMEMRGHTWWGLAIDEKLYLSMKSVGEEVLTRKGISLPLYVRTSSEASRGN